MPRYNSDDLELKVFVSSFVRLGIPPLKIVSHLTLDSLIILLVTTPSRIYIDHKMLEGIRQFLAEPTLQMNSNTHSVAALAFICAGNDISLDCFAFRGQSAWAADRIATPPPVPPQPSSRRLMKKTSAGVEKVARPVRRDLAVSPSDRF